MFELIMLSYAVNADKSSSWLPGWLSVASLVLTDPGLAAAIGPHDIDALTPVPIRTEGYETAIG